MSLKSIFKKYIYIYKPLKIIFWLYTDFFLSNMYLNIILGFKRLNVVLGVHTIFWYIKRQNT